MNLNQITAQRILNFRKDLKLNMDFFVGDIPKFYSISELRRLSKCPGNMSFCAAGELARLDNYPEKFVQADGRFSYTHYTKSTVEDASTEHFLFGYDWSNSFENLMERAQYLLEHGASPDKYKVYEIDGKNYFKGV